MGARIRPLRSVLRIVAPLGFKRFAVEAFGYQHGFIVSALSKGVVVLVAVVFSRHRMDDRS